MLVLLVKLVIYSNDCKVHLNIYVKLFIYLFIIGVRKLLYCNYFRVGNNIIEKSYENSSDQDLVICESPFKLNFPSISLLQISPLNCTRIHTIVYTNISAIQIYLIDSFCLLNI